MADRGWDDFEDHGSGDMVSKVVRQTVGIPALPRGYEAILGRS